MGATNGNGSCTPSPSTGVMICTRVRHGPRGRDMSNGAVRVWRKRGKGERKRGRDGERDSKYDIELYKNLVYY